MAFGTESYRDTFSGSLGSYIASKIQTAAQNAKQEKENQKKAEELGIEVPEEEKKGLFKRALGYEFGGRKFDQKVGPWMKGMSTEQSSKKAKFSDQFSYTKALKQTSKTKKNESLSAVGRTTKKKGSSRASFVRGFGEVSLQLEQLNQRFSSLVSIANQQLGATYRMSGGIAGLHNVVAEQADVQRDQLDEMKSAKREASIEQSNLQSGSSAYSQTTDLTPGSDEFDQPLAPGATSPSVPGSPEGGGGGGLFDTIAGVADMADTALDVGRTAKNVGKRGLGRGLTRAGAAVGGRKGAKAASKIGSKFFGKAAGKGVVKAAGKGIAKGVGKSLVKKIPIVGALAGIGFGVQRAMSGDWLGAAGEVASGLAATVPGAGTAVSAGIDAALIGKDIATPEKQAEGGVMPLSSRMAMNMIPGVGPLASMMMGTPGMKDAMGKGKNLGVEEAAKLPLKAIGGAILSVTSGFIKALGPVAGVVAPMINQQISPLARMLGMPSSLVSFGGIGGAALSPAPQAMKAGMDFMKDFMKNALEKLGIKPKKEEEKTSSSGSSGGGGGSGSSSDDSSTEDETPSASPGATPSAPAPGMRAMTGDEYAAKVTKEVKGEVVRRENLRGGGTKNVYGITDARLAPVKNAETGTPTPYYHDTFGQLYKMNPNDGKVTRLTQDEITAAQSIAQTGGDFATGAWHFFRKPDKNVVIGRLQSMPVGSIKIATKEIVYEEQKSARSGRVKRLRQPSQDERTKYGIDQIKTPFGAPSAPVPQVQAASGVSITSNGGGNKQLTPGRTFGFADLNPHHSDEGRTRQYGGMAIGVPKDYGMGVLPNYMPSGPNGRVPLPVPGKVLVKEWNKQSGYGRTVIVETNLGKMQFSHLSKFGKFNVGDQLAAGAVVGVQGGSGDSGESDYAEHLHLNATKKGHEAFVNFITSGKPTTGVIDDTDSPGNEDAGNNQEGQEPEDPMEALRQNITGLLGNATALGKAFAGGSYEEATAAGKGIDFNSLMGGGATAEASPAESTRPAPAPQPQAAPTRPNPTMQPAQTTPVAAGKPAVQRPTSSDAASAQIASAAIAPKNTNSIVPVPMGANVPASGFRGVATEFSGSARDLRPIHPNLA